MDGEHLIRDYCLPHQFGGWSFWGGTHISIWAWLWRCHCCVIITIIKIIFVMSSDVFINIIIDQNHHDHIQNGIGCLCQDQHHHDHMSIKARVPHAHSFPLLARVPLRRPPEFQFTPTLRQASSPSSAWSFSDDYHQEDCQTVHVYLVSILL